jgi:hypothetical protein
MDFWKTIIGLVRRKLLFVPLVGSAVAVALTGYFLTPLQYASSTTMVLVTPAVGRTLSQDPTVPVDVTNPLLSFSNDLKTASTILIWAINAPDVAEELGADDDGPTHLTINDGRTDPNLIDGNGPFIYVAGESTSRAEAKDVVIRAQKWLRQELQNRQKSLGAPPETYLTMVDVVAPTSPKVVRTNRIKVGGAAFVLMLVLGLCGAYVWQSSRRRRAASGPPKHDDKELESSRDWNIPNDLVIVAEERSGAKRALPDTDLANGEQRGEESERDQASRVVGKPQAVGEELVTDNRPEVAADREQARESEQSAKTQQLAYHSQEHRPAEGWDLYGVGYPPHYEGSAPSSARHELDLTPNWGLNGFESERPSAVVGANGGIVSNKQSETTSMGGLEQMPTLESNAADRDVKEVGLGAEYGAGETPESNGQGPNGDLPDGEHVAADEKHAAIDEQAGEPAPPTESERVAHPLQEATHVKDWDLYIADYPPDDVGLALRSEHDELHSTWEWDFDGGNSERGSATARANGVTDVIREHQRTA